MINRVLTSTLATFLFVLAGCASDSPNGGTPDTGLDGDGGVLPEPDSGPMITTDADGDGIDDRYETDHGLDPMRNDAAEDLDGDGINNLDEFEGMTRPNDVDSDDDGLGDGEEDRNHNGMVDPGESNAAIADTDGDGILDGTELGRVTGIAPPRAGIGGTDPAVFRPDSNPASTTNPASNDTDGDGIPDGVEDKNRDGRWDMGETDPVDLDSDDDGLTDGIEDANRDGVVDAGETHPGLADTDRDGIPDGVEKGVDTPVADPDGAGPLKGTDTNTWRPDADPTTMTNPTVADTDGDGVLDGDEDWNHNGRVDPNELDPSVGDTDMNGVPDINEGVSVVCSAASLRQVGLHALASADVTLALPLEFSEISILREMSGNGVGIMFRNPTSGVVGFAVSRAPMGGDITAEKQDVRNRINNAANLSNEQDRALITWDGYPAVFTTANAVNGQNAIETAADMARRVAQAGDLTGALPGGGGGGGTFTVYYETILRTAPSGMPLRAVIVGAIAEAPTSDANLIQMSDVANGTGIAQFGDFTGVGCDPFTSPPGNDVVDLLWVVDNSGSMAEEQSNVAAAGTEMVSLLSTTQLSWRLGLISTEQVGGDIGCCGVNGFTNSAPRMQAEAESAAWAAAVGALGTGGSGEEQGAAIGITAAQNLLPATVNEDPRKFRQGASVIIVHMSDEEDWTVKMAAGGNDRSCPENGGKQTRIDQLINGYRQLAMDPSIAGLTTFAIHGIQPNTNGADFCDFDNATGDCPAASQHGRAYIDIATAMGGGSASICGNMNQAVQDIIRAGAGIASQISLTQPPISATIRVVMADEAGSFMGQPDIPRSRQNGFDYAFALDVMTNRVEHKIVFYGTARPPANRQLMISYRTWQNGSPNPAGPDCDCGAGQRCDGDTNDCEIDPTCGGDCMAPAVCDPNTGMCTMNPNPNDPCMGMCGMNEMCIPDTGMCVEMTDPCGGCNAGEICDTSTNPPSCRGV